MKTNFTLTLIFTLALGNFACSNTPKDGKPSTPPQDSESFLLEDARVTDLTNNATLIVETKDWLRVRVVKPFRTLEVPLSGLSELIVGATAVPRSIAAVEVPPLSLPLLDGKTQDEQAIEVDRVLRKAGFSKVVFFTTVHGFLVESYAQGLPTKEEVSRRKEVLLQLMATNNGATR